MTITKRALLYLGVPLGALLIYIFAWATGWPKWESEAPSAPPPSSILQVSRCTHCHPGGSPSDPIHQGIDCTDCHLGDDTTFDEASAHAEMEAEPGALDTVLQTCGRSDCHTEEAKRVASSLMTTNAGIISVNRFAAGELEAPDGHQTMAELLEKPDPTSVEDYTRKKCAGCHLGSRRDNRDDAVRTGGSGCGACHSAGGERAGGSHQPIDAVPGNERCLGCHSRSGRISLSYQGLAEITGAECKAPAVLFDGRPGCKMEADVHHEAGLKCVDCHLHTEVMGDGIARQHQEEQTELACESCHGPNAPETKWSEVKDPIARRILGLRGESRAPEESARVGARGTPLWNLRADGAKWRLFQKGSDRSFDVPQTPSDANHDLQGHERLNCASCHAKWAPVCTDCHVSFDPEEKQWDFASAEMVFGAWEERTTHQGWGDPALAVVSEKEIAPAIPGMVMTWDFSSPSKAQRQSRLYAAIAPHTTARRGRSCVDCHLAPFALGLGEGKFKLANGAVEFAPARPDPDGRAADRWTELDAKAPRGGTRANVRSLSPEEIQRVLTVAPCLSCHGEASDPIYRKFAEALVHVGEGECRGTRSPASRSAERAHRAPR